MVLTLTNYLDYVVVEGANKGRTIGHCIAKDDAQMLFNVAGIIIYFAVVFADALSDDALDIPTVRKIVIR